jgi:uncharacterized protein YndB with AHSA1/START domain
MGPESDRIERRVFLRAPRQRVWRALVDAKEFGSWFGARLSGRFAVGERMRGPVTHAGYEHLSFDVVVESIDPERSIAWRWRPGGSTTDHDPTKGPTTLVRFTLEDAPGGTMLTMVESGFDSLPPALRDEVYRGNVDGWSQQAKAIEAHVAKGA